MAEEIGSRPLAVDGLATEAQPPAPAPAPELEKQVLLILVGLPGSSKSTFANALAGSSREPNWNQNSSVTTHTTRCVSRRQWTRVSQDEAPSRRRQECERQVIEALRRGENVVVDRVNFDPRYAPCPIILVATDLQSTSALHRFGRGCHPTPEDLRPHIGRLRSHPPSPPGRAALTPNNTRR